MCEFLASVCLVSWRGKLCGSSDPSALVCSSWCTLFSLVFFPESDDEYSDDDDISWKVRRSAAKCLEAIVSSRHDLLQDFYKTLSPVLISRFKEREENVKADIFSAYISLLKQTLPIQSWLHASDASGKDDVPLTMLQHQVRGEMAGWIKSESDKEQYVLCHRLVCLDP